MTGSPADLGAALSELRMTGHALDDRVAVTVDGRGRVVSVVLEARAMKAAAAEIADAVASAAREAQDQAAAQAAELTRQAAGTVPDQGALIRDLGQISRAAQGRLDEMTANLDAVLRRLS